MTITMTIITSTSTRLRLSPLRDISVAPLSGRALSFIALTLCYSHDCTFHLRKESFTMNEIFWTFTFQMVIILTMSWMLGRIGSWTTRALLRAIAWLTIFSVIIHVLFNGPLAKDIASLSGGIVGLLIGAHLTGYRFKLCRYSSRQVLNEDSPEWIDWSKKQP